MAPASHVFKAGPCDYRVRVYVAGKKREVGGFTTREQAKAYLRARPTSAKRSKTKRHATKRHKKVGWRYRLRRAWRRLMKRRRK